jgi:aspartate aminotransferase
MVKLCNGVPILIDTNITNNFKITPDILEKHITKKTKAFIFSSPCNPTGSVYSKSELQSLSIILAKYPNIIIISDEIYEYINYTNTPSFSIASLPEVYNQTVTLNGLSKSFAMTGWRVGYMGGPKWLSKACEKIQGQMTSGINAIAQCAAIRALDIPIVDFQKRIKLLKSKRDLAYSLLSEIQGFKLNKPQGAFYIFIDISYFIGKTLYGVDIHDADDLSMLILNQAHVATVGGGSFGNSKFLRVSYAVSIDNLIKACQSIKNILIKTK